jgi:hypothetical protein
MPQGEWSRDTPRGVAAFGVALCFSKRYDYTNSYTAPDFAQK